MCTPPLPRAYFIFLSPRMHMFEEAQWEASNTDTCTLEAIKHLRKKLEALLDQKKRRLLQTDFLLVVLIFLVGVVSGIVFGPAR